MNLFQRLARSLGQVKKAPIDNSDPEPLQQDEADAASSMRPEEGDFPASYAEESPYLTKDDLETNPFFAVTRPLPPNADHELLQATKAKLLEHMDAVNRFHRQDIENARERMQEVDNLLGVSDAPKEPGRDIEPEI
jgi:hypothetical protein